MQQRQSEASANDAEGAETVLEILAEADGRGFVGQFVPRQRGMVECLQCEQVSAAPQLEVSAVHRLEGVSDPADLLVVVEARCPRCATGGSLVLGYGPNTSGQDADVLVGLDLSGRR